MVCSVTRLGGRTAHGCHHVGGNTATGLRPQIHDMLGQRYRRRTRPIAAAFTGAGG